MAKAPVKRMAEGGDVSGMDTKAIQRKLKAAGFDPGPIDGIVGPRTRAAVREFQRARGLTVDGIAGPRTKAALSGMQRAEARPARAPERAVVPASRPTRAPERVVSPPSRPARPAMVGEQATRAAPRSKMVGEQATRTTPRAAAQTPKGPVGTKDLVRQIASEEMDRATTPAARAEIRRARELALEQITRVPPRQEAPAERQVSSPLERRLREALGRNFRDREPSSPLERRLRAFFRGLSE